jgi:formylglycine-generating enzyme required for sulfatase activity
MKRILGIAVVLGLVTFIAGCSKEKATQIKAESASEKFEKDVTGEPTKEKAPQIKAESALEKFENPSNERGILKEPTKKESSGKEEVIDLGKDVKLEMVLIPAGKFLMGGKKIPVDPFSNIKVEQPPEDELPQHEVTLTKSFYMGKYEVTQEQWVEIMGENPSRLKGRKLPVSDVSWEDCQEFIKKLNGITKGKYRLPTEAEWEYACRAGTSTEYSFGAKITPKDANYYRGIGKPIEVGSYKPNAFGLYDMHGNVLEWCEDWYGDYPKGAVTDPKGPATGKYPVFRGGSFNCNELRTRSSFRNSDFPPAFFAEFTGFRLARTP